MATHTLRLQSLTSMSTFTSLLVSLEDVQSYYDSLIIMMTSLITKMPQFSSRSRCSRASRFAQDALTRLGKGIPSLQVCTLIGGVPVAENVKTLEKGCHIAVGTPGRVKFLMDKGVLTPGSARTLVLESADWLIAPVFLVGIHSSTFSVLVFVRVVSRSFTVLGLYVLAASGKEVNSKVHRSSGDR